MNQRSKDIGRILEALVNWARILDSKELFSFGGQQLSRSQIEVLFVLAYAAQPVTPGLLADRLRVTKGAISQLVGGLTSLGLVYQNADETDGRKRVLTLTETAAEKIASCETQVVAQLAHRFASLDANQLGQLADLLTETVDNR